MGSGQTPRVVEHADEAYESIRAINHLTIATEHGIPAPVVYQVLGNLKTAGGYGLAQALEQLARDLGQSLAGYDVYEDDGSDPARTVALAVDALQRAAADARRVGALLDRAQSAVAGQGYHQPGMEM